MFGRKKPQQSNIVFIENAGGCICTKSVLNCSTRLKWCWRAEPVNPADNGWRFIGADDTEEYINVVSNNAVVDFNTVANIAPAILGIYTMPIGTDLRLEYLKKGGIRFYDTNTGEEVAVSL